MDIKRKKICCFSIVFILVLFSNLTIAQTPSIPKNYQSYNINHMEIINQGLKIIKLITNNQINDSSFNLSFVKELKKWYDVHPMIDFTSIVENTLTIKFIDGTYTLLLDQFITCDGYNKINNDLISNTYKNISNYHFEDTNKKALILNPCESMYGGGHCKKIINILLDKGYCLDYLINQDVDISYIRDRLQAEIIYLNTHAGYWDLDGDNKGDVVVIATGELWTVETQEIYKFEFENQMIVEGVVGNQSFVAFTPSFIQYYYQENNFPDSLVYMATCYAGFDTSMANAFLESGAKVYVGWKRNTISWTNSQTSIIAFKLLAKGIPVKFVCFLIGYGCLLNLLLRSRLVYYGNGYYRISKVLTAKTSTS